MKFVAGKSSICDREDEGIDGESILMLESFRNVEGGVARPTLVAGCLRRLGVEDVHFRKYFAVFVGAALLDGQCM